MFEFTLLLIFPAAMAFAGALDLLTMTIPNRISVALAAAFAFAAYRAGLPFDVVAAHLAAAAMVLAVGIVFFAFGWLGGGDAKLMSVAALWIVGTQLWFYRRRHLGALVMVHAASNLAIFVAVLVAAAGGRDLWYFVGR